MIETLKQLYEHSGAWADPILVSTLLLFLAGSIMLFTVRLIKRFIFFTILALLLPNSIGVVGTLQETGNLKDAVIERGEQISDQVKESIEDFRFSPLYLGLLGSAVTVLLGAAGVAKIQMRRKGHHQSDGETLPRNKPNGTS